MLKIGVVYVNVLFKVKNGSGEYVFCVYYCERGCMYVNTPTEWSVLEYPRQVNFEIENFGVIIDIEWVFNIFISIVCNYYILVIILFLILVVNMKNIY